MSNILNFSTYLSPFTWRYGSSEMRTIFSEKHKIEIWHRIWVALAKAQMEAGIVSKEEYQDLEKNRNNFDLKRILEIEKETGHDVVAAIREFAEKAKVGGGKIHLGATSMDIVDNTDTIRIQEATRIVSNNLRELLSLFSEKIEDYANLPCIGYTHLQPAEPTTLGYRFAFYAQDLLTDLEQLKFLEAHLFAKGLKGAVGTAAGYKAILKGKKISASLLEAKVMNFLGIKPALITTQVSSRKTDYSVLTVLSGIASSISKFASDVRILQSPNFGEWSEPFGKKQVGSSAMPFKKNPVNSEKICSLARYLLNLPAVALENASLSYLERTLDDSANRRIILAESFLALDEIMLTAKKVISGLVINKEKITFNLNQYAPFAATEIIIIEAVKRGADRQEMHELIRELSIKAWTSVQAGLKNPLKDDLLNNKTLNKYLKKDNFKKLFNVSNHVGDAPERALLLVKRIKNEK